MVVVGISHQEDGMEETFESFMQKERDRLTKAREEIYNQQQALQTKLDAINREMTAIEAYAAAKAGKPLPTVSAPQPRRSGGGRKGEKRQAVLDVINAAPDGISRGEIIEKMGAKGDKSQEQSISNALSAMKKANVIGVANGKYIAA